MVSLTSLAVMAIVAVVLAAVVARLRGPAGKPALADALAALAATLGSLLAADLLFLFSGSPDVASWWRDAASVALLAGPLAATAALRFRGRRSIPRALLASAVAVAGVVVWLTLHLRGPRGGWATGEVVLATLAAAITVAAAACAGWWSKRPETAG